MKCSTDPELFFDPARTAEAVETCAACPLADKCRQLGERETYGVWGGSTPYERAAKLVRVVDPRTQKAADLWALIVEHLAAQGITDILGIAQATGLRYITVACALGENPKALDDIILRLQSTGLSFREIALQLGMTKSQVGGIIRRTKTVQALAA